MPGTAMKPWRWWWLDPHLDLANTTTGGRSIDDCAKHSDDVEHTQKGMVARQSGI